MTEPTSGRVRSCDPSLILSGLCGAAKDPKRPCGCGWTPDASGRVRSTYESPTEIHRSTSGRVQPHDRSSWRCDPDALVPLPDSQYGTVWRCPVCQAEYVDTMTPARTPTPDATP